MTAEMVLGAHLKFFDQKGVFLGGQPRGFFRLSGHEIVASYNEGVVPLGDHDMEMHRLGRRFPYPRYLSVPE